MEAVMQSTLDDPTYNSVEQLICTAARLMVDHTTAFIGTGIPMLAAALAQRMHAPHLVTVFEFGGMGAILDEHNRCGEAHFHQALAATGICDVVKMAQRV
jgi:acyl CoA:acetate/3-ketoacid CoA transferase beta subunit